ncbi:MAG: hypothetical protein GYB31_07520 [Bacteroidetes bacterium]|nr:hypothetical protein [Bacteroidota bacterium]
MRKIQDIELYSPSFFVGALFPFVDDGEVTLLVVQHLDKYKSGKVNTKLPGGSAEADFASETRYFERLEADLNKLGFDRRTILLILNQEYSRRAQFRDHSDTEGIHWMLQTLVLRCLEATGYYPADLDPRVVDIVERSEDHYQYFFEIKEWWDKEGEKVEAPQADAEFKPLDTDIQVPRDKMPITEFEDILIGSHCRPVEFYLEHLRALALKAREDS